MAQTKLPDLYEIWDYGDPAATAVTFRSILLQAESSGDIGYTVELLTQIARAEGLQGKFTDAQALLDEAEAMLPINMPIPQIRIWLERGRSLNSAGQAAMAMPLFKQAFELGKVCGEEADFYTIDAAHMLGIVLPTSEEQLEWNLLALALTEETAVPRAQNWCGSLLNNLGWTYHNLGEYQQALITFEEAYDWHIAHSKEKPDLIRIAKWCVARTYRSLGRYLDALTLQEEIAAEYRQFGLPTDGFVSEEIGECLLVMGRAIEARPYFAEAYKLLSQVDWISAERLAHLKHMSEENSSSLETD